MYHILLENKRNSDFAISKKDIVQNAKLPFLHTLAGIVTCTEHYTLNF